MGYTAQDENLFNRKNKLSLDRYKNLINEYDNVIKNYNGIVSILNNPTASAYPYQNEKQTTTEIAKKYRDKKYLSFKNNETFTTQIKTSGSGSINISKGYYEIVLIGPGSGGIYFSKGDKYAASSGTTGAAVILDVYFSTSGTLTYTIGKPTSGLGVFNQNGGTYTTTNASDSEVYFNNNLIAKCTGGNGVSINTMRFFGYGLRLSILQRQGGVYTTENYIYKTIKCVKGNVNNYFEDVNKRTNPVESKPPLTDSEYRKYIWNYETNSSQLRYGNGGMARTKEESSPSYSQANSGITGVLLIRKLSPSDMGYLDEGINLESTYVHTLGNENNIRRAFKNALSKIYNKLSLVSSLTRDSCSIIGEPTTESTTAKKYSQLKSVIEKSDKSTVIIDPLSFLSEVKTKFNENMIFPEDDYILTYDINTLRKIYLSDYTNFLNNGHSSAENYYSYKCKDNGDIIFIKNIPNSQSSVDVYKRNNNKFVKQGNGTYYPSKSNDYEIKSDNTSWDNKSVDNNQEFFIGTITKTITDEGYINVTMVGSGGGGSGGSGGDHWYKEGACGGSGAYLNVIYKVTKNQTVKLKVGAGGRGGYFGQKHSSDPGFNGTSTQLFINNELYATAGAGTGGLETSKHGSSGHSISGNKGINVINKRTNLLDISQNIDGLGNTENEIIYTQLSSLGSVYPNSFYGAGGDGGHNGGYWDDWKKSGEAGYDGYGKISITEYDKIIYNNNVYYINDDDIIYGRPILWADYEYDLQKLNRLKQYVATKDSWFDSEGYCQRSCQINCQTTVQKS